MEKLGVGNSILWCKVDNAVAERFWEYRSGVGYHCSPIAEVTGL